MSPNPLTPNFIPGVGQLTTSRYDFQKHLDGINEQPNGPNFRHTADQIDLNPALTIDGYPSEHATTVQQALQFINENFFPAPPLATSSVAGLITLSGDLNGVGSTALIPMVGGLQGIPVSNNTPTNNQYLQFLSGTGKWTPTTLVLAGDVTGPPGATVISAISASSSLIPIGANLALQSSKILTLLSGATLTANSGSTVNLSSTNINFDSANINFSAASALNFTAGSTLNGTMRVANNSTMSFESISQLDFNGSNYINIGGSAAINNLGNTINVNWPTWQTPVNRSLIQPVAEGQTLGGTWLILVQGISDNAAGGSWVFTLSRLQNGGTLSSVVVTFNVAPPGRTNIPAILPNLSVVRCTYGNETASVNLSSTDPQFFPTPGSGTAYYDGGAVQKITYTCNQNNVIDNTKYYYVVIITDESGLHSEADNNFYSAQCNYTNIPDQSWNI
jgi:hypothetical protein